jgi:hypothetical protein
LDCVYMHIWINQYCLHFDHHLTFASPNLVHLIHQVILLVELNTGSVLKLITTLFFE